MKSYYLLFLGMLFVNLAKGQSISPEVLASSGNHFIGSDVQLSWTIGEGIIETYSGSSIQLTQGFHQGNLIITSLESNVESLNIQLFPNPTAGVITLQFQGNNKPLLMQVYDLPGRLLLTQKTLGSEMSTRLDLSTFAPGAYFLQLADPESRVLKTFKIIKTN